MIYLLTANRLTPGGSSTVQKQYTEQHNKMEFPEQNVYNNKNKQFTKLNRSMLNIKPYIQWYKIEPKEFCYCSK
jgi:hypothetical protein